MAVQQTSAAATSALIDNSTACLSHSMGSWILDSGASDHVVGNPPNPSLISNLLPPKIPHSLTLANGSKTRVTGIGQASPLPSLSLNYVLFVPDSPFNLISISKLANGSITFCSNSFSIQERGTGKTNGTGYESQDKLKVLVPHLSHLKSLNCESCQLGKHVRASFPSSANKKSSPVAPTPQQNGVAERKHRHLVDTARILLINAHAPLKFWGDAMLTANYLINRMPSSVLDNEIPHSLLFPKDPLYAVPLRVFGSTCFVHDHSPGRDKLSARAVKYVTFFEDTPFFASPTTSDSTTDVTTSE
ncbi:receptor-like protein kinase, partial [Trifolium pratense]